MLDRLERNPGTLRENQVFGICDYIIAWLSNYGHKLHFYSYCYNINNCIFIVLYIKKYDWHRK